MSTSHLRLIWAAVALMMAGSFTSSAAASLPNWFFTEIQAADNQIIQSIQWPSIDDTIAFKSIFIGEKFNLEGNQVHLYVHEGSWNSIPSQRTPFMCTPWYILQDYDKAVYLFNCKIILLEEHHYPQAIQAMTTAFGDSVQVSFGVILNRTLPKSEVMLPKSEVKNGPLGHGRIFDIDLKNSDPATGFVARAVRYFSKKFSLKPVVRISYHNPHSVYSKECARQMLTIGDKSMSTLSLNDLAELKKCNSQATLAILSGKASSARTVTYFWEPPNKFYNVQVGSVETNLDDQGGKLIPTVGNAEIFLQLKIDKVMHAYVKRVRTIANKLKKLKTLSNKFL